MAKGVQFDETLAHFARKMPKSVMALALRPLADGKRVARPRLATIMRRSAGFSGALNLR